jgi:hypothetical protein
MVNSYKKASSIDTSKSIAVDIGERYTSMVEEYVQAEKKRQELNHKLKKKSQGTYGNNRANTTIGGPRRITSTISSIAPDIKEMHAKEIAALRLDKVDRAKYNIGIFKPNIDYITSEKSLER